MPTYTNVPNTWVDGYIPLWYRCVTEGTKMRGRGAAMVTPAEDVLDYFTHEPVVNGEVTLSAMDSMIRLLAKPGDYIITFGTRNGETHDQLVTVTDPVATAEAETFRDGKPLWRRPGKYDQFIISENPYRKLPIQGTVLDCGSHIGTFARDALNRGATSVTCYEPEPVNFALLTKNTEGMPVTRHQEAISGTAQDAMNLSLSWTENGAGSGGNSLFKNQSQRPVVSVRVEAFTTALWQTRPGAVKLDIKNAECEFDWPNIEWPDDTAALAMEADVDFMVGTVDPALTKHGFTAIKMPPQNGWKRSVAIWAR